MDSRRATCEKDSSKSTPSICEYPLATNLDLFLVILHSPSSLFLLIYFTPMTEWLLGRSTNTHTLFLSNLFSFSFIVIDQESSFNASKIFLGSILDINYLKVIHIRTNES
ncbi:hypothetical protein KSP39_PZI019217 [Platanthera zijinensis]|uniref:Uncharacterized protein n=1 Tax=Platanthera zijinensis TaxID=2320716 RepID=A0AAP0FY13_9ASPA